ncbi:hypothetical protein FHW68_003385 [Pseudomonas sp. Tn43]|nr:hypothetical protein [Pseudomonas sp. Tn43]
MPAKASSLPEQFPRGKPEPPLNAAINADVESYPQDSAARVTLFSSSSKLSDDSSRMRWRQPRKLRGSGRENPTSRAALLNPQ